MLVHENGCLPPVALGKVSSYPEEHRVIKVSPYLVTEPNFHRSGCFLDRWACDGLKSRYVTGQGAWRPQSSASGGGSFGALSSHGQSIHTGISTQTGAVLFSFLSSFFPFLLSFLFFFISFFFPFYRSPARESGRGLTLCEYLI